MGPAGGFLGPYLGAPREQKPRENICFGLFRGPLDQDTYLEASCRHLGPSWGLSGPILEPSWAHLGVIWGAAGGFLGPSWGQLGASWAHLGDLQVTERKTTSRRSVCFCLCRRRTLGHDRYLETCWGHLGAILGPLWAHLGDIRWSGPPRNNSGTHGEPQEKRPALLQQTESRHFHVTPHRHLAQPTSPHAFRSIARQVHRFAHSAGPH